MKLLFYSHYFAPSIGGVETIVRSLARGISELSEARGRREFDVTVITETAAGNFDDAALPFRMVRRPGIFRLWKLIRSCDVLHLAGPALAPLALGLIARKAIIVEHHGFQTICPNGQLFIDRSGTACPGHFMAGHHAECLRCNIKNGWLISLKLWVFTFFRRFLCTFTAANVVPTQWLGGLLYLPKTTVIPHGLDSEGPTFRIRIHGQPVIAYQGRLVTTKGVAVLLRAARLLHDQGRSFELLIVGDGPERDSLRELACQLGIETLVNFVGTLPREQLEAELSKTSIVAVPSLAGEVFGLVVAENMQRSNAIVASDIGAFSEVLGNAGITFRTGDHVDLANKLAGILDDHILAEHLGDLAQKRVYDCFRGNQMIEGHARLYRTMCDKKPS